MYCSAVLLQGNKFHLQRIQKWSMCIRLHDTLPPASVILTCSINRLHDRYSCFVQGSVIIVLEIADQRICMQNAILWFPHVTSLLHLKWDGGSPALPWWRVRTAEVLPWGACTGFSLWRSWAAGSNWGRWLFPGLYKHSALI